MTDARTVRPNLISGFALNEWLFRSALVVVAVVCTAVNYNYSDSYGHLGMSGHEDYANYFRAGFHWDEESPGRLKTYTVHHTFPMWGYGCLLVFVHNKLALVALQQVLTLVALFFCDSVAKRFVWKPGSLVVFRVSLLASASWFFFHTLTWAYSINANLVLIALLAMFLFARTKRDSWLFLSALCFGVALNFRSDYVYFPFAFGAIAVLGAALRRPVVGPLRAAAWLAVILATLVPWGVYTYQRTAHYLLSSTNGGHVLFLSLGLLPGNKWKITPRDWDPTMRDVVDSHFAPGTEGTCDYKADQLLTRTWLELVRKDPGEYAKKCLVNALTLFATPFYLGDECIWGDSHGMAGRLRALDVRGLISLLGKHALANVVRAGLNVMGILIMAALVYYAFRYLLRRRSAIFSDEFVVVFGSVVAYQIAFMILAFFSPTYNTNQYIAYLMLAIYLRQESRTADADNGGPARSIGR